MSDKPATPERFSLSRWSRRKLEAKAEVAAPSGDAPTSAAPSSTPAVPMVAPTAAPELPSVDSLNFNSDFTAFLRPEVDENLKRAALKRLFRDPRFNVMDGLDTYIDDYTKADPIEPGVLKEMLQRFSAAISTADSEPASSQREVAIPAPTEGVSTAPAAASVEPASPPEDPPEEPPPKHSPS